MTTKQQNTLYVIGFIIVAAIVAAAIIVNIKAGNTIASVNY